VRAKTSRDIVSTTKMNSNPWSVAFKRAIEVEEEGAKDFVDILAQHAQKKLRPSAATVEQSTASSIDDGDEKKPSEEDSDSEPAAASSELAKLSRFVMESTMPAAAGQNNTSNADVGVQPVLVKEKAELVTERDMVEVCGRQMCRAWLKHHYLKIGSSCKDGDACLRKHAVTCKPELLYKDYSFKGLSPKQRKTIMEQIKAESAAN